MDLAAPFRPEVLRPLISVVVPGFIAISPYVLLLRHYVVEVERFLVTHPRPSSVFAAFASVTAGFIISDFGELIEVQILDRLMARRNRKHDEEWCAYLKLRLNDELVGQRFLRTKLTQFKFELAMVPALLIFWIGLLWLQFISPIWTLVGFVLFSATLFAGTAYLAWESWLTARALGNVRKWILEAVQAGPLGISISTNNGPEVVKDAALAAADAAKGAERAAAAASEAAKTAQQIAMKDRTPGR